MKTFPVLVLLLPVLACGAGGLGDPADPADPGGGGEEPGVLPIRLAVPARLSEQFLLPDLLGPLAEAIGSFEAASGRDVRVEYLDDRAYDREVRNALMGESPPDVAWMPATLGESLAGNGRLLPLEGWVAENPHVLEGTQAWMEELYTYEGHLHAVPVGEKGTQSLLGYVVTVAAAERGHDATAMELVAHLRELVPLRGRADLALDELAWTVEDVSGGDVIQELTYLDAMVRNIGDAPAEDVRVVVEIEEEGVVADVLIPWIETSGSEPLRVDLGERAPGRYVVHTILDPEGRIPELNEVNNKEQHAWSHALTGGGGGTPSVVKPTTAPLVIDLKASATSAVGMNPKVAFDGTYYLVVWAKQVPLSHKGFHHQLRATRISQTGAVLDPGGFLVASKISFYTNFSVVFGGGQYLVVWEEDLYDPTPYAPVSNPQSRIQAARVSTAGKLLDTSPIVVEQSSHSSQYFRHRLPRVHFDGTNFVIIYVTTVATAEDCGDPGVSCGLFAKRISSAGALLPGRSTLQTLNENFTAGSGTTLDTEFLSGAGLVILRAFEPKLNRGGHYALWFTSSGGGAPVSSSSVPVLLGTSGKYIDWPCTSLQSKNNYLAVWSSGTGAAQPAPIHWETEAALIAGPGSAPSPLGPLKSADDMYPAVAYDGTAYTIVTCHRVGCHAYVGAIRLSPGGAWGPSTYFPVSDLVGVVDIAFGATNGLVVFTDFNPPSTYYGKDYSDGVWFRLIDKSK